MNYCCADMCQKAQDGYVKMGSDGWSVCVIHITSPNKVPIRIYIAYCPWCGTALTDGPRGGLL